MHAHCFLTFFLYPDHERVMQSSVREGLTMITNCATTGAWKSDELGFIEHLLHAGVAP